MSSSFSYSVTDKTFFLYILFGSLIFPPLLFKVEARVESDLDQLRIESELYQLQGAAGGDNKFPARAQRSGGEAVPLPPPSGQSSPTATGQRDVQPAGGTPPPVPPRPADHNSPSGSLASSGPSGAGARTPPAVEPAAGSWPPSSSSFTPRLPTARVRNGGSARYYSSGAMPRRTRSSGSATPGPDLDSILRRRRRENRKKGKGAKTKAKKKSDSVILISTFRELLDVLSSSARSFHLYRLLRPFYRQSGVSLSLLLSLNSRLFASSLCACCI